MRSMALLSIFLALPVIGCATAKQWCEYENGALERQIIRSTVIGSGETEFSSIACGEVAYSTRDTGLSDNGKEAFVTGLQLGIQAARPGGQLEGAAADMLSDE